MPLPQIEDFLKTAGDGPDRQIAARSLDLFEAYLEGHPVSQYDPAQEAWFGLFIDGRGISAAEKADLLEWTRKYVEYSRGPAKAAGTTEAPKEVRDRFKPGPSVAPPPKPGWTRGKARQSLEKAKKTAEKAVTERGVWLAPLIIMLMLVWAGYSALIDKPFEDFEFDIRERLRRNKTSSSPAFGAWIQEEGGRRGFSVIAERSSQKVVGVNQYFSAPDPMYELNLRVGLSYQTPLGINWDRTLEIVDETYVVPADWPPVKRAIAPPPLPRRVSQSGKSIPREKFALVFAALEASRANVLKFYEENPDESLKLLATETSKLSEQIAKLPEPGSNEEQFVINDLKESLNRIERIAAALRLFGVGQLDSRGLRQAIDTLIAQSEYAQRKAESRLSD